MIVYFSATGNCKYAANEIAKAIDDTAVSILDLENQITIQKGEKLGIVTPTYYWGLPSVVDDFFTQVKITAEQDSYVYFIATYGTTCGQTGELMQRHLIAQGLTLSARYSIKMPDTWTPTFDLSNPQKVSRINQEELPQIAKIIAHIQQCDCGDYMHAKIPMVAVKLFYPLYHKVRKTTHLYVEDSCIGCGMCENNCPVQAIQIKEGKPVWVKDQCVMCLGCLHHCPKFAIQYGRNTKKHGQYVHP